MSLKPTLLAHQILWSPAAPLSAAEAWQPPDWPKVAKVERHLKAALRDELNAFARAQESRTLLNVRGSGIESAKYSRSWEARQLQGPV